MEELREFCKNHLYKLETYKGHYAIKTTCPATFGMCLERYIKQDYGSPLIDFELVFDMYDGCIIYWPHIEYGED